MALILEAKVDLGKRSLKRGCDNFSTNAHHLVEPSAKIVNNVQVDCWTAQKHLGHHDLADVDKDDEGKDLFMMITNVMVSNMARCCNPMQILRK